MLPIALNPFPRTFQILKTLSSIFVNWVLWLVGVGAAEIKRQASKKKSKKTWHVKMKWKDLECTERIWKPFSCADLSCSVERSAKLNTEEAFPHLNSRCQEKLKPALPEEEALQIKTDRHKHGSQDKKRCPSFVKCCMKCQKEFLNWYVGSTTFVFPAPRQSDTALWSTVYHGSRCDRDDTSLIQSSHVRVSIERAPLNVNSADTQGAFKTHPQVSVWDTLAPTAGLPSVHVKHTLKFWAIWQKSLLVPRQHRYTRAKKLRVWKENRLRGRKKE